MNEFQCDVISIIKSALSGEKLPAFDGDRIKEILSFSVNQQLLPVIYYGLTNSEGFSGSAVEAAAFEKLCYYLAHDSGQKSEIEKITAEFDRNGIEYILLKGSKLKKLYPSSEMRTMGDCDILVKEEKAAFACDTVKNIGYEPTAVTDNEFVFVSSNKKLHLELHRALAPDYESILCRYYSKVWDTAVKITETRYELAPVDELCFLTAHLAKHLRSSGAGVKYIVDFYVYLNAYPDIDKNKLYTNLKELSLYDFYLKLEEVLAAWFESAKPTRAADFITDYVFSEGTYGNAEKWYTGNEARKNAEGNANSTRGTVVRIFFPTVQSLTDSFPSMKNRAYLYPFYWFYRALRFPFSRRKSLTDNIMEISRTAPSAVKEFNEHMTIMGLENYRCEDTDKS